MNDLSITGRMTADAIFTKGQEPSKNRCTFVVAVTDPQNSQNSDFFYVTAWGSKAEYIRKGMESGRYRKGCTVEVNGPIHLNEYETQNREKRYQLQVIAERTFSEKKKNQQDSSGNQNNAGQSSYPQPNDYGQYPTGPNGNQNGNGNSNYGYGNSGNSSQRGSYNNNRNGNNRQNAPHYNNQGSQPPQSGRTYNANGFQGNSQNGRNNPGNQFGGGFTPGNYNY